MRPAVTRDSARALAARGRALTAVAATLATFAAAAAADDGQPPATPPPTAAPSWALTALYSHSALSGGRPDWDMFDLRLLDRVAPQLVLGVFADPQRRPPDTDVGYGGSFSWYPLRSLEWRGEATAVPMADFLPRQTYATGAEWRADPRLSVALDYRRQNFSDGPINQWTPALTLWFSDATWLTARYSRGRAFDAQDYSAYAVVLNLGMADTARLTLTFAHGADPEKDPGVPGVILSKATTYAAYYHWPLQRSLDLIVGAEYEDRPGIYTRTTGSVGVNVKF